MRGSGGHGTGGGGGRGDGGTAFAGAASRQPRPRVRIDPRIRQRRIEVRREEGRRRLRLLLCCVGAVASVAVAVAAIRSPLLDVDGVDVRGARHTGSADVVRAAGLGGSPAMVDVDPAQVAERVEALPWVATARAVRRWPGTVRIEVSERAPAAVVPAEGGRWGLVDAAGRVLAVAAEKPPGLPVVGDLAPVPRAGVSVARAAGASLRVLAALPDPLRARVADVATAAEGEVELRLADPAAVVRLGPPEQLDQKLEALATLVEKVDLRGVAVMDLRAPRAPVLTRR